MTNPEIPELPPCPEHGFKEGYILCSWCSRNRERALKYVLKLQKKEV